MHNFPPLDLLARLLGVEKSELIAGKSAEVDLKALVQIIALRVLAAEKSQVKLSEEDCLLLQQYFREEVPAKFAVDPEFYLSVNLDVAEAAGAGLGFQPLQHFAAFGLREARA